MSVLKIGSCDLWHGEGDEKGYYKNQYQQYFPWAGPGGNGMETSLKQGHNLRVEKWFSFLLFLRL